MAEVLADNCGCSLGAAMGIGWLTSRLPAPSAEGGCGSPRLLVLLLWWCWVGRAGLGVRVPDQGLGLAERETCECVQQVAQIC